MKFAVEPLTVADLEAAKSIYGPETGDLCAAVVPVTWPIDASDLDAAQKRAAWSCQQQQDLIANDPTARTAKVVDQDNNNEIIAVGRWHRYPQGYQHVADLECVGLKDRNDPATWPEGLDKAFYLALMDPAFEDRTNWMGTGSYWVLTNIVTREPFRRRGAGSHI